MEKGHRYIWVKTCIYRKRVESDTIIYCKSENRKVHIYMCPGGEIRGAYHTLADMEKRLPKDKFFRCNRTIIVNVDFVDQFSEKIPAIILTNGEKISLAKDRKDDLARLLKCNE